MTLETKISLINERKAKIDVSNSRLAEKCTGSDRYIIGKILNLEALNYALDEILKVLDIMENPSAELYGQPSQGYPS